MQGKMNKDVFEISRYTKKTLWSPSKIDFARSKDPKRLKYSQPPLPSFGAENRLLVKAPRAVEEPVPFLVLHVFKDNLKDLESWRKLIWNASKSCERQCEVERIWNNLASCMIVRWFMENQTNAAWMVMSFDVEPFLRVKLGPLKPSWTAEATETGRQLRRLLESFEFFGSMCTTWIYQWSL